MAVLFEECKCDTSLKDSVSGRKFLYQLVQLIKVLEHDGGKDIFCVCAYCVCLSVCRDSPTPITIYIQSRVCHH